MQFDTFALQVLQAARDQLAHEPLDSRRGICVCIYYMEIADQPVSDQASVYSQVLREAYMPHLSDSVYWWPINQPWRWRAERLAFLDRVIEDLMCGESFRTIPGGPSNA